MTRAISVMILAALGLSLVACGPPHQPEPTPVSTSPPDIATAIAPVAIVGNPAAPGFDAAGSDRRAIELADRVMERLGGRAAWEDTRYLTWRFFGGRRHVWDKWTGNHRFEADELTVLSNINDAVGRAWEAGVEVTDADTLAARLDKAQRAWINDSYWLVMPYKLKDSGVALSYVGEGMTEDGLPANILEMTFRHVGRTPQNRYQIWVDIDNSLVRQWSFYASAEDEEPKFVMPWANWQPYGEIWLNDDFSGRRHSSVAVYEELPEVVFTSPAPYF